MKRKLIEVALPLETINRESAREKSILPRPPLDPALRKLQQGAIAPVDLPSGDRTRDAWSGSSGLAVCYG